MSARYVIGPDGLRLTLADLPVSHDTHWTFKRKADVVYGVRGGLLTLEEACDRYKLSVDEFIGWQRALDKQGIEALKVKNTKGLR